MPGAGGLVTAPHVLGFCVMFFGSPARQKASRVGLVRILAAACLVLTSCQPDHSLECGDPGADSPVATGELHAELDGSDGLIPMRATQVTLFSSHGLGVGLSACDDQWGGYSRLKLTVRVPVPTLLPAAVEVIEGDGSAPRAGGGFTYCAGATCPQTTYTSFGDRLSTEYTGNVAKFDPVAGALEFDFEAQFVTGGPTIHVAGDLKWDSDYTAPELPPLGGHWELTRRLDAGADGSTRLEIDQDGALLSGRTCADECAEENNLNGYVSTDTIYLSWTEVDGTVLSVELEAVEEDVLGGILEVNGAPGGGVTLRRVQE